MYNMILRYQRSKQPLHLSPTKSKKKNDDHEGEQPEVAIIRLQKLGIAAS
jgi:hypothetical protein